MNPPVRTIGRTQDPIGSLKSFLEGEEKERQRLSRELHDGIGQYLIAIKMKLESLLYSDPSDMKEQIKRIKDDFDQTVEEVRRISNNLKPSVLEAFGIVYALRNLCVETSDRTGIKVGLFFKGNLESLDMTIKTYLFRIAQEALNNVVRHSEATMVDLRLDRKLDDVYFSISDNGIGFTTHNVDAAAGHGMNNMRDRVKLLNGTIDIKSAPDKGTLIMIKIPAF
ncbi:MAG TPA: sensor histidine kinase [Bacteroidales bacterium]|nr:sensor histidine kinase [Bacteroidales bacterium]HPS73686.1 sensor histidine kinase [Bacteroidales bacterium]